MKAWTISKTSYLWRFASVYGPASVHNPPEDLCTLMRNAFWGFVVWSVCMAFAAVGGACLGDIAAWVYVMVELGQWIKPNELAAGALSVILGLALFLGSLYVIVTIADKRKAAKYARERALMEGAQPSTLELWFKSVREKTCFRIKVGA